MVDSQLLRILACPVCKTHVKQVGVSLVCENKSCRRTYKVEDDVPIMLPDSGRVLPEGEWKKIMGSLQKGDKK
ncbi:Uncharacterised protein [uncultured archaeon]|nr:Uncharacterised protein [uncultured archaeon]